MMVVTDGISIEVIRGKLLGPKPPMDVNDGNDQLVSSGILLGAKTPPMLARLGNERLVTAVRLLGLKPLMTVVIVGISTDVIRGKLLGPKPPIDVNDGNDQLLSSDRLVIAKEPASVVNDGKERLVIELSDVRVRAPVLVVDPNTLLVVAVNDGNDNDVSSGLDVIDIEPAVVNAGNDNDVIEGSVTERAVLTNCNAGNEIDDNNGNDVVIVTDVADFSDGSEIDARAASVDRTRPPPPMTSSAGILIEDNNGSEVRLIPCELYFNEANETLVNAGIEDGVRAEFSIVVRASAVMLVTLSNRIGTSDPSRYCRDGKDNEVIDGRVSRVIPPTTLVRLGIRIEDSAVHSLIVIPYVVTDLASMVSDVTPLAAPPSV